MFVLGDIHLFADAWARLVTGARNSVLVEDDAPQGADDEGAAEPFPPPSPRRV